MYHLMSFLESKRRKRDAQIKEAKENELKELEKRHKKEEIIKLKQQQRAEVGVMSLRKSGHFHNGVLGQIWLGAHHPSSLTRPRTKLQSLNK